MYYLVTTRIKMACVLKEFIDEFNLEKPYENPHIENIQISMLTTMFEEFEKIRDKNQVILSDSEIVKTDNIDKQREIYNHNNNNGKNTIEFMTKPINYVQTAIGMLTNKDIIEWYTTHITSCGPCNGRSFPSYNMRGYNHVFDYNSEYKHTLNNSLEECYKFYQSLENKNKSKKCEHKSRMFEKMFKNKCSTLYYLLLEHAEFTEYLFSIKSKTHGLTIGDLGTSGIKIYKLKLPAPSNKQIEVSDKVQQILHDTCEMVTITIKTNGHSCNNENKTNTTVNKKDWLRLEEHKKLIDKTFCDIVAYGYMQAKLLKLESVKIYTDIVSNLKLAVSHEKVGQVMGSVYDSTLSQVNIYTLDDLDLKNTWDNSEKCFSFMTKSVTSHINSKKMLVSLEDEDMTNMPQITERIADLKKEIKSSNDYLVTLFTQYIAVKRRELNE